LEDLRRAGVIISIHSPHVRGDDIPLVGGQIQVISIHSPHVRGDCSNRETASIDNLFQSTPLM